MMGGCGAPTELMQLIEKVKSIQKSGESEKQKWWNYCQANGRTKFDPAVHGAEFLKSFLTEYHGGTIPGLMQSSGGWGPGQASSSPYDGMPEEGRVLRVRGVPFNATIPDIAMFFSEYGVTDAEVAINFGMDRRPSGEVYVVFPSAEYAASALETKNQQNMGKRYVELFQGTFQEWGSALDSRSGGPPAAPSVSINSGDPALEELVDRIKDIQRSGAESKQKWWTFCDQQSEAPGYDPRRHSATFLHSFILAFDTGAI